MELAFWLLLPLAALGHFATALWLFNRLHAEAWPYRLRQVIERLLFLATLAVPLLVLAFLAGFVPLAPGERDDVARMGMVYGGFCLLAALLTIPCWLLPRLRRRVPDELRSTDIQVESLKAVGRPTVQGMFPRWCASLPGNEVFELHVETKTLRIPRLPPELAGLRIAHLTDLHLTGKIGEAFYAEVVRITNELRPDLIAITGDIAERQKCLPWIERLFSELRAPHGKFFILGNHDFLLPNKPSTESESRLSLGRMNWRETSGVRELRTLLAKAGVVDLAARCEQVMVRDIPLLVAGNELPWHGPAPEVPPKDETFRLLLAHTPDLFLWAQAREFDLMLAGHNHGGQIRLPWIGPLISPSRHGTRYASGLFRQGPTLMHVSRGIGGEHLLRWNCPPELSLLVLEP